MSGENLTQRRKGAEAQRNSKDGAKIVRLTLMPARA